MNLQGKNYLKYIGLIGLLALFFITSCEDKNESVGIGPGGGLTPKVIFREIPLETSVVKRDSIRMFDQPLFLVGSYQDTDLGRVTATTYTQTTLGAGSIAENGTYDSLVLVMRATYFYGNDFGAGQNIFVKQLVDTINTDTTFYTFDTEPTQPTPLNTVPSGGYVIPGNDSILAITLDDTFGSELFSRIQSEDIETFRELNQFFKGLAIEGDDGNTAIYGFNPASEDTKMIMYYQVDTDSGVTNLKYNLEFNVSNGSTFNYNNITPNTLPNRAGTALAGMTNFHEAYDPGDGFLYMQNATGEMIRIDFTPLEDFKESIGEESVIINSATLRIGPVVDVPINLFPPSSVSYFLTDEANEFFIQALGNQLYLKQIQRDNPSVSPFDVRTPLETTFSDSRFTYEAVITLYMQQVIDGNMDFTEVLISPNATVDPINRLVVDKENVTLRLFYSVPQ